VNGEPIDRFADLSGTIGRMKPGSEARLTVWRNRKERGIEVKVVELEDEPARVAGRGDRDEPGGKLGLAVRPLTREEKRRNDTKGSLVVEQVQSPAAESGVRPGDIILGVNGTEVRSVEQLREAVDEDRSTVALLIERGEAQIFIAVPIA
jgi:serine protease Do